MKASKVRNFQIIFVCEIEKLKSLAWSKLFDILMVFLIFFFQKDNFEKKSADNKKA